MLFRIHLSETKGRVLLVTDDVLPGVDLFSEKALLSVPKEPGHMDYFSAFEKQSGIDKVLWIGFTQFRSQLSIEDQLKVLALYGPTDGERAAEFRVKQKPVGEQYLWDEIQIEQFVQYCMIASQNAFLSNNETSFTDLFETASRMSHSCQPNCCVVLYSNNQCTVRTILPVRAGDELTISYNCAMDHKPTLERRNFYLREKDFICDCPRCTALGDDTRQFDYSNIRCSGIHRACQPTSDSTPFLVPCNVCALRPNKQYQTDMFHLEANLPLLATELKTMNERLKSVSPKQCRPLILRAVEIYKSLPKHHRLSNAVLNQYHAFYVSSVLKLGLVKDITSAQRLPRFLEIALAKARVFQHMTLSPNLDVAAVLENAAKHLCAHGATSALETTGLQCAQQALRIHLLHFSRTGLDCRDVTRNIAVRNVLSVIPPQTPLLSECAFCGENPIRVVITLERCKKCKKVAYCTGHCMEAHWDVHTMVCGNKEKVD